MFNKKALSLAVATAAAGLSLSANAVIDLDAATGAAGYAQETVVDVTSGVYNVSASGDTSVLQTDVALGVGVSGNDIFVRYDFTNAQASAAFDTSMISIANSSAVQIGQGGIVGSTSVIYTLTPNSNGFAQTDTVSLAIPELDLMTKTAGVSYAVYETLGNAINESLPLKSKTLSSAVTLSAALSSDYAGKDATAEVTSDFMLYNDGTPAGTTPDADLGGVSYSVDSTLLNAANGITVGVTDIVTLVSSVVTYTGDFQVGTWDLSSTSTSCTPTATLSVDTVGLGTATAAGSDADGTFLCNTVGGTTIIQTGDYSAATMYVSPNTNPAFPLMDDAGDLGSIGRNGTTVEIAYITTFTDYNQRVVIVNRNSTPVDYSFSYGAEAGTTCTALAASSGTLMPNENLVLKATDLVDIAGTTRCSATFTAVAPSDRISIATTQVNLSDKSTDTVSYN